LSSLGFDGCESFSADLAGPIVYQSGRDPKGLPHVCQVRLFCGIRINRLHGGRE